MAEPTGLLNQIGRLFNLGRTKPPGPSTGRLYFTGRTPAGVYVDADTALRNDTVWACVQYLTKTVAQLPWRVMQETKEGATVAPTHPADWLIHQRPCPDFGSFSWRQIMLGNVLRYGNGYAEIQRDNRGAASALWPLHPNRVKVRRSDNGELEYEVYNEGGSVTLPAMDVFHVRGFGDGVVGMSVIEHAAQSIGWAQATMLFGSTFFSEGMNPSGIIETPKSLSIEGGKVLREEMGRLYKGQKGERTAILDAGMKFTKLPTNPNDCQFVESMQHQVETICRWFGVPPHKVQHLLRATFSNIENQSIEVVVDSIVPWAKVFEEEANYKLFGTNNRQGFFTKMNVKGLLRGDSAARGALYKALFETGALSPNDILRSEDMNTIGPDGDARFVSNNVQPLSAVLHPPAAPEPAAEAANDPALPAAKPNGTLNGHAPH